VFNKSDIILSMSYVVTVKDDEVQRQCSTDKSGFQSKILNSMNTKKSSDIIQNFTLNGKTALKLRGAMYDVSTNYIPQDKHDM